MEMKFDMGMALIEAVISYKQSFMRDSLENPEKTLVVVLSREARDVIIQSPSFGVERYGGVGLRADQIVVSLLGLPVELSDDVHIMDIRRKS